MQKVEISVDVPPVRVTRKSAKKRKRKDSPKLKPLISDSLQPEISYEPSHLNHSKEDNLNALSKIPNETIDYLSTFLDHFGDKLSSEMDLETFTEQILKYRLNMILKTAYPNLLKLKETCPEYFQSESELFQIIETTWNKVS
ncbi:hypothetical protein HMI54_015145 [Coelomomyces lativittatus]|nr:hypothetical protein HMI56_004909 [Coelomomyces lativittatus]KAJ1516820.1 hypothetical protein HMI55_001313 [Coelomomyces lativittatus]KAJ1518548.1 hypothetical protein HMI54_015145 [Coelomomyces lativittatus]